MHTNIHTFIFVCVCTYTQRTSGAGLRATRFFSYLAKMAFISGVNLSEFFFFISSMLPYGPFCIAKKTKNKVCQLLREGGEGREKEEEAEETEKEEELFMFKDTGQYTQWLVRDMGGVWVVLFFLHMGVHGLTLI